MGGFRFTIPISRLCRSHSSTPTAFRLLEDLGILSGVEDDLVIAEFAQSRMNVDYNDLFGVG